MLVAGVLIEALVHAAPASASEFPVVREIQRPQLAITRVGFLWGPRYGTINLNFTVSRDVAGTMGRTALVVSGAYCYLGSDDEVACDDLGATDQVLPDSAFSMDSRLTTGRLRARWFGYPLEIDWKRAKSTEESKGLVGVLLTTPIFFVQDFRNVFATATTRLLGRPTRCRPDILSDLTTGRTAQREPSTYASSDKKLADLVPVMRDARRACL